jgi:aspartyl-tRNA(Asn)/glutamyl-tRNA(Gln) amidotransferase subunit A
MASYDLCFLSAAELSRILQKRDISPVEVVEAHLKRIEALEPALNSFITRMPKEAMAAARQAEKEILSGRVRGPLHGIPFGLKDLYYVKDVRNTSGTKIFDQFIPAYDSAMASRLREAGAILMGKLNLHPLAYGPTGENIDYGDMHNPWDLDRITGGSSGGSGSAVASGQCTFAMGTDTGGSIRIPSALCGIVGLKPTYGLLSRYGITVLSWSQDHPGPMARTVRDCALVLKAAAGHDPNDPASARIAVPEYTKFLTGDVKGLRIGILKDFFEAPIDPEVEGLVREAMNVLPRLGAILTEVSWPMLSYSAAIAGIIQMSEATACHRELIKKRGKELMPMVRLRLESGFFISGQDYVNAQRARTIFYRESLGLFDSVDLLCGPSLPVAACKIGTTELEIGKCRVGVIAGLTQYTRPFNLCGFPAITVPCGFTKKGLPVGLQIAGRPFDEASMLGAAYAYEQATEWHKKKPMQNEKFKMQISK